jgi:hypothetical protein
MSLSTVPLNFNFWSSEVERGVWPCRWALWVSQVSSLPLAFVPPRAPVQDRQSAEGQGSRRNLSPLPSRFSLSAEVS